MQFDWPTEFGRLTGEREFCPQKRALSVFKYSDYPSCKKMRKH